MGQSVTKVFDRAVLGIENGEPPIDSSVEARDIREIMQIAYDEGPAMHPFLMQVKVRACHIHVAIIITPFTSSFFLSPSRSSNRNRS